MVLVLSGSATLAITAQTVLLVVPLKRIGFRFRFQRVPPVLMVNADRDIMRASGDQFAVELVSADGDVERHVLPETQHAFLNRPHLAAFTTAIDLIASWSLH